MNHIACAVCLIPIKLGVLFLLLQIVTNLIWCLLLIAVCLNVASAAATV